MLWRCDDNRLRLLEKYALILAGGAGTRMQTSIPKQFLFLENEPIVVKTIGKFLQYDPNIKVIVVLPADHISKWETIKKKFLPQNEIISTIGGNTRGKSVLAGLNKIAGEGLIAIHDAVRPFVSINTISQSFLSAQEEGCGVACVQLNDSIREVTSSEKSYSKNRKNYRLVQTPQTFRLSEIKKAYEIVGKQTFTDDASVFEHAGFHVKLVEGNYENIKITNPSDLY